MNLDLLEKIVNAVLYEGYMLYPYRPSAVKNQQRFNFGALYPKSYSIAGGGVDAWTMQTECLFVETARATVDVSVRFLHLLAREIGQLVNPQLELPAGGARPDYTTVAALEVGDKVFQAWQEAIERDVSLPNLNLSELVEEPQRLTFTFPSKEELETLRAPDSQVVGVIIKKQQAVEGAIEAAAERVTDQLYKLTVRISNLTPLEEAKAKHRDESLMRAFASTHTILSAREGGEFVSLLDPPEEFREFAARCRNVGTWPVLVGAEGERDVLLSSPIILYDYPQIAPESAGDLFDGTEIDEILTLRIMTLTDEEKREMRGADGRARQILERTETLPAEQLMKLHGALRSLRPAVKENER
jgi:hydrogenase maturation protease